MKHRGKTKKMIDEIDPPRWEVWHHFKDWEEVPRNMWGSVSHRSTWLTIAATFTGNPDLYGEWMMRVVDEWPKSCQHNLTKPGDKRAWIGHAAVAMAIGCPEDIVREAWGLLTEDQRARANTKAQAAIDAWKEHYAKENAWSRCADSSTAAN